MATRGRLEGRITVPAGGWTATVGGTATIAAGTYYATTLLTAVGTAFASASGTSCTATASLGEAGTGVVTIAFGSSTAIAWVSTDLRDILGFGGDSAAAGTHVSPAQMRGTWLPNCAYKAPNAVGSWRGHREADFRASENAAGYVWAHMGQEKEVTELSWNAVERARVWEANETTDNASWERFVRDCLWGVTAWGTAGGPIRFYPDAADSDAYVIYRCPDMSMIKPEPFFEDWAAGPWRIVLPRLVADSDTTGAPRSAITFTHLDTNSSTTDSTTFTTASISPTANKLVLVAVTSGRLSSATPQRPSGVAGAGLTFTLVAASDFQAVTQARTLTVWRAMSSSPSSGALTISFANTHGSCVWSVIQVTGASTAGSNGSGAIVQSKTGIGADPSTTLSVVLDSAVEHAKNVALASYASATNNTYTAGTGYTLIGQDLETLASASIATEYKLAGTSSNITAGGVGGAAMGGVLIEIKAGVS